MQAELSRGSIIGSVLEGHEADIIELQRKQLFEGKGSDGNDLRPYYTEDLKPDGWFTTRQKAENYMAWKQSINYPVNVQRNPNAPNLYITGIFHNDLGVRFDADSVAVVPDTAYAAKIMGKYGMNVFGLSSAKWSEIFNERGAKDELIMKMKDILWQ